MACGKLVMTCGSSQSALKSANACKYGCLCHHWSVHKWETAKHAQTHTSVLEEICLITYQSICRRLSRQPESAILYWSRKRQPLFVTSIDLIQHRGSYSGPRCLGLHERREVQSKWVIGKTSPVMRPLRELLRWPRGKKKRWKHESDRKCERGCELIKSSISGQKRTCKPKQLIKGTKRMGTSSKVPWNR